MKSSWATPSYGVDSKDILETFSSSGGNFLSPTLKHLHMLHSTIMSLHQLYTQHLAMELTQQP